VPLARPRSRSRPSLTAILGVVLLLASLAPGTVRATSPGLPALPVGWPLSHLAFGLADGPGGASSLQAVAPFELRYQYLAGGVNTGAGWQTWNPNGTFVSMYVSESAAHGIVPVFSYYMLRQSLPGAHQGEYAGDLGNLHNVATMTAYWKDMRTFMQRAAGATPVVLQVEPDMWGYAEQSTGTTDDATRVPAEVGATGLAELAGLPDTLAGFAQAVVRLRDRYAPNVILGYHLSFWGTDQDPFSGSTSWSTAQIDALAARSAAFYHSLGTAFDVAFTEFSDRDAAFKQIQYGDGGASWWDAADFANDVRYLGDFSTATRLRLISWQIPVGNQVMQAMDDTWGHYQDNRAEWLLGPSSASHLADYVNAGVIAFLFGGGASGTTCACDADGDGITNPPAIDGNTTPSYSADDDGGYLKHQVAAYYAGGAIGLPGGVARLSTQRLAGADRFGTSAAVSAATFAPGVPVVYVASGLDFPDALAAGPAAATQGGPVLIVTPSAIPPPIATELARLKPARIVVVGGPAVISAAVRAQLAGYTTGTVAPVYGADRYATAAAVSASVFSPGVPVVFLASGAAFPDALSAGAVASHLHVPVLLVQPTAIPSATRTELDRLHPAKIVIVGGTGSVSAGVAAGLAAAYPTATIVRLGGADRYATGAAVSAWAYPSGAGTVFLASGLAFPDALAGAVAAGMAGAPVLLTGRDTVPAATLVEVRRLAPDSLVVLGGVGSISEGVVRSIDTP